MSWHGGELLLWHGENVVNMIMNGQSGGFHSACLHPLHDFLARYIEDGCQDLLSLLSGGLRQQEQHARAVLYVFRRKQLPLQQDHDEGCFRPVKASRIAAPVQLDRKSVV